MTFTRKSFYTGGALKFIKELTSRKKNHPSENESGPKTPNAIGNSRHITFKSNTKPGYISTPPVFNERTMYRTNSKDASTSNAAVTAKHRPGNPVSSADDARNQTLWFDGKGIAKRETRDLTKNEQNALRITENIDANIDANTPYIELLQKKKAKTKTLTDILYKKIQTATQLQARAKEATGRWDANELEKNSIAALKNSNAAVDKILKKYPDRTPSTKSNLVKTPNPTALETSLHSVIIPEVLPSTAPLPSTASPSPAPLPPIIPDLVLATATATALGTNLPNVIPIATLPSLNPFVNTDLSLPLLAPVVTPSTSLEPDVITASSLSSSNLTTNRTGPGIEKRENPSPDPEETIDKIENTLIQIWPDLVKIIGELSMNSSKWQDNKSNIIKYTQHIGAFSLLQNV